MKRIVLFTLAFGLLVFFSGFCPADCRASDEPTSGVDRHGIEWRPVTVRDQCGCRQVLVPTSQFVTADAQVAPKQAPKVAQPMPVGPHPVQTCEPPLFTPVRTLARALLCGAVHHMHVARCHVHAVGHAFACRRPVRSLACAVVRVAFFRRCR